MRHTSRTRFHLLERHPPSLTGSRTLLTEVEGFVFVDPNGVVDARIPAFLVADGELVAGDGGGEGEE
ncbi:hypothetical protein DsansV1_C03g0025291 [Dioscorea sansibarensis]